MQTVSEQDTVSRPDGPRGKIPVLVLCDDTWHPGAMVRQGLAPLAGNEYEFRFLEDGAAWSGGLMAEFALVVLAKSNVISGSDKRPWLAVEAQTAFQDYVHSGHGLLVVHAGTAGYQELAGLRRLTGGRFVQHPELCMVDVVPRPGHPVVVGVKPFLVRDEHYFMALEDARAEVFLHSHSTHGIQPAGWTRPEGRGRVCVLTPGHTEEAWMHPMFQTLLRNALGWALAAN